MTWFEQLVSEALVDPYLDELLVKAEKMYTSEFFNLSGSGTELGEKEFVDILRFADILCRSKTAEGRNKSYKIISLLYDHYQSDYYYQGCAEAVLTKLGLFPTINLIGTNELRTSTEAKLERSIKEVYQQSPFDDKIFTDAQYALFEKLKNSNHFSFSGPTSFGKTMMIGAFINYIIESRNGSDNIVILVPTRALINQISSKLRNEIKHPSYKVLTHPVIPQMFRKESYHYIYIFTPERWIAYVSDADNPVVTYMFVDEAQKVISQKDSRAPLYYHAILLAQRKSVNLYFASPNIPNAEVFLELFEKSQAETMVIQDSPVAQNRYFFDFIEQTATLFSDTNVDIPIPYTFKQTGQLQDTLWNFLIGAGKHVQNIVYCNTIEDTIRYSCSFSKTLPCKNNSRIDDFINLIKTYVHKDYFLIDCVRHGVAFHFGRLPQRIREQVEILFSEGELEYVFCTSTLLEGVNLPAKNIFILNNAIGLTKFSDIDFWNLAGRAGRFTKELSGNIICVRAVKKENRWDTPQKDLTVVRNRVIKKVAPTIISGEKNFYKNIGNAIAGKPFTNKSASQVQQELWKHYSNILCIHEIGKSDSVLSSNFLKGNSDARKILAGVAKSNHIPLNILEQSSTIKLKYQNEIWESPNLFPLPTELSQESCLKILETLYAAYHWDIEESGGRNPMVRNYSRLEYFSILMYSWIKGDPLNLIINRLIRYYDKKGKVFYQGEYRYYSSTQRFLTNHIINELMADIDTALRFKIKNYILNYSLICNQRLGDKITQKWVDYIEYGTTDPVIISLQTLGIPRHLASFIMKECPDCILIEQNEITAFDEEKLRCSDIFKTARQEFCELSAILDWK